MYRKEGFFKGLANYNLYHQYWLPSSNQRGILLIAHGFAEHSGRYTNLVDYFVPRGWAVYALDHRGHGKSDGARVQVERFSDYVDDLKIYFDIVRKDNPGKKIFLVGHSMGSAIAILYTSKYQNELAGLVTSGGGIDKPGNQSSSPQAEGQPLGTSFLSRDPEVIKAYENDPLVYRGPIPTGLRGMMSEISNAAPIIRIPALIMAGNAVADGTRSQVLFEALGSKDKTLKLYDGLRHEIFNEPEHIQVISDMAVWLENHLS
jgi:acylglycerol lipase